MVSNLNIEMSALYSYVMCVSPMFAKTIHIHQESKVFKGQESQGYIVYLVKFIHMKSFRVLPLTAEQQCTTSIHVISMLAGEGIF